VFFNSVKNKYNMC